MAVGLFFGSGFAGLGFSESSVEQFGGLILRNAIAW
jgi:hypothetical protein